MAVLYWTPSKSANVLAVTSATKTQAVLTVIFYLIYNELASYLQYIICANLRQPRQSDQGNYNWELHSEYDTWTQAESHRVGGYPFFTQDDVRGWEHSEPLSNYVLLF